MREVSDLSLVSLDPCSIHHSIYLWCDCFPCFDASWSSLTFLSLCFFLSLFHYFISLYVIWFLFFLILLDVWLGFNTHALFLLIQYVHSFIIIFHVRTPRSVTHEVFYASHHIHEGYGDYIIRIFESSFLSFLSHYYLSLRYVLCLKTTPRPWLHTLCLTAHTWVILEIGGILLLGAWWMRSYDMIYIVAYPFYQRWIFEMMWSTLGHNPLIDEIFFEMMPYIRA